MADFTRDFFASGSRNWITDDPNTNYGITCLKMWFRLIGPKGAVQWTCFTPLASEPVREHLKGRPFIDDPRTITGADLGYHAKEPQYEAQHSHDCDLLGGKCYYDGSSLNAEYLEEGFLALGSEYVWEKLEAFYANVFEGGDWPDFSFEHPPHPSLKAIKSEVAA